MNYILLENMEGDNKLSEYILNNFKNVEITVTKGKIELIEKTNIKKITPIVYKIKFYKSKFIILYFKCEEIEKNKYFFLKTKKEYNLLEIKGLMNELLSRLEQYN